MILCCDIGGQFAHYARISQLVVSAGSLLSTCAQQSVFEPTYNAQIQKTSRDTNTYANTNTNTDAITNTAQDSKKQSLC